MFSTLFISTKLKDCNFQLAALPAGSVKKVANFTYPGPSEPTREKLEKRVHWGAGSISSYLNLYTHSRCSNLYEYVPTNQSGSCNNNITRVIALEDITKRMQHIPSVRGKRHDCKSCAILPLASVQIMGSKSFTSVTRGKVQNFCVSVVLWK